VVDIFSFRAEHIDCCTVVEKQNEKEIALENCSVKKQIPEYNLYVIDDFSLNE